MAMERRKPLTLRERLKVRNLEKSAQIDQKRSVVQHTLTNCDPNYSLVPILESLLEEPDPITHSFDVASRLNNTQQAQQLLLAYLKNDNRHRIDEVRALISGLSQKEIAEKFGLSYKSLTRIFSKFRSDLEQEILNPLGFIGLTYSDQTDPLLRKAGYEGTLHTFKILNTLYTSQRAIKEYQQKKRMVNENLLDKGYVLLNTIASSTEYDALLLNPYFSQFVVKSNNRWYILPSHFERFKREYKPRSNKNDNHQRRVTPTTIYRRKEKK